jgi:hypothetical protein
LLFNRVTKGHSQMPVWSNQREVIKMKERMQQSPKLSAGHHDPCVHVAGEGVRVPKICLRNHECWHCAFDQWIEAVEEAAVDGYRLPDKRRILRKAA